MYSDCEIPEFYRDKEVTAKKDHKCCECRGTIKAGEKYLYISGKWGGDFSCFYQHLICRDACEFIRDNFQDGECIEFGGLYDYYPEYTAQFSKQRTPEQKQFRSIMAKIIFRKWRQR